MDFEYSVNGKMYQFSLPGGGFSSFTDLIEVLGIIGDTNAEENEEEIDVAEVQDTNGLLDVEASDAAKKFVADVASVEFSSPELVDISKVENETTVGQIKDSRGLECQYSAELTEEQIEEINSTVVESGDWALISVQPFESTESLTVTMKTGEVFEIRVTDYQLQSYVMTDGGETYKVTVTYNDFAEIPEDAELKVKQYSEEDPEYQKAKLLLKKGEFSDGTAPRTIFATDEEEMAGTEENSLSASDFLAFDISIFDKEGNVVEPKNAVKVTIELVTSPLGADVNTLKETMEVHHIVKEEDTETAVLVADTVFSSEGTIEIDEDKAVAEFVTESFSTYTISWGNGTNQKVTLHFVDENGNDISSNGVTFNGTTFTTDQTISASSSIWDADGKLDLTQFQISGYTLSNTHKSTWQDLEGSYVPADVWGYVGYNYQITQAANYPHTIIGNEIRLNNGVIQYRLFYTNNDKAGSHWFNAGTEPVRDRNHWQYNQANANADPSDYTTTTDNDAHPYDYYLVYSPTTGSGGGTSTTPQQPEDLGELGHTKEKTSNYDGTYNLELGVSSKAIVEDEKKNVNVLLVIDTSSSMNRRYDSEASVPNPDTNSNSRIYQTRQAVTGFVSDLLKNNTNDNPNAVELELITFDMGARVTQEWIKDETTFNYAVNHMARTSGTNWAEAIKLAQTEALAKNDGDPTYVLFLTDGAPSQYWDSGDLSGYYVSGEGCYLGARDEARDAVLNGVNLYTIFSYGTSVDQANDYLGKLTDYAYNSSTAKNTYRSYVQNASQLETTLTNILNTIVEKHFSRGEVQINDGITELTTVAFEEIDTESFEYTISYKNYTDPNDPDAYETITMTNGNGITVTGSGNDQVISIPSVTYHTFQKGVYKEITTKAVEIKGAVFAETPSKKVTWKLEKSNGGVYLLEDNWTYNVKFRIWPSQDSYDLLAALNNHFLEWGEDFVNGDHTVPASEYMAQIDNSVSPYALKTNTEANVTYKEVTSTTIGQETTYSYGDEQSVTLPTVTGMPLDNTMITLEKVWNSTLSTEDKPNEVELYILVDPTPAKITAFNAAYETYAAAIKAAGENAEAIAAAEAAFRPYYYFKAELNESGSWKKDVSIAPGVYDQYGNMNTTGHTYMVMEPAIDGHYELEATPTHPMLNGLTHDETDPDTLLDMIDVYTESGEIPADPPIYEQENQKSKYSVANTLKAGININKEIVDVPASQQDYLDMDEFFTVKVTLEDKNNQPVFDRTDGGGAVGYRIYAPAAIPEGAVVAPEGAEGNDITSYSINGITYEASKTEGVITGFTARGLLDSDGTKTLKIRECESLRIVNVPLGTTYTVEEIVDDSSNFKFKEMYWEVKKSGAIYDGKSATYTDSSTTQTIVPDAENNVVFRNKPKDLTQTLTLQKTGTNDAGLSGAIFQLMVKNGSGVYQPVAEVTGYDGIKVDNTALQTVTIDGVEKKSTFTTNGAVQTLQNMPVGGYKLVELQAPAGYIITQSEMEFSVTSNGNSLLTSASSLTYTADPTEGNAQLTVENTPGAALPNTGGPGTRIFTILGSILILGAGVLLWRRRRLI